MPNLKRLTKVYKIALAFWFSVFPQKQQRLRPLGNCASPPPKVEHVAESEEKKSQKTFIFLFWPPIFFLLMIRKFNLESSDPVSVCLIILCGRSWSWHQNQINSLLHLFDIWCRNDLKSANVCVCVCLFVSDGKHRLSFPQMEKISLWGWATSVRDYFGDLYWFRSILGPLGD